MAEAIPMDLGDDVSVSATRSELEAQDELQRATTLPPRGCPYNAWLPYAAELKHEAAQLLQEIKHGFADVIARRELVPGLKVWCIRLEQHLSLYKFDFSQEDHVYFVRLLFDIFATPDQDHGIQQICAQMLRLLLRKEEVLPADAVVIPWEPFFDRLHGYYFAQLRCPPEVPKSLGNAIAKLAVVARRFFPAGSTEAILARVRPLLCPHDETVFRAAGFLSLLLPTDPRSPAGQDASFLNHMDELFGVWNWVENTPEWDLVWLNFFARATKHNVGAFAWEKHLDWLFNKFLAAFHVPVGSGQRYAPYKHTLPSNCQILIPGLGTRTTRISELIIYMWIPGNGVLEFLRRLFNSVESFFHPSNTGDWSSRLAAFMYTLCDQFVRRLHEEGKGSDSNIKPEHRLKPDDVVEFVRIVKPIVFLAQFSKSQHMVASANWALRQLSNVAPDEMLPPLLERVYPALQTLTESHQTMSAISALVAVARPLLKPGHFPNGTQHLVDLLMLSLPGIDPNDLTKTQITIQFYSFVLFTVPMVDCSKAPRPEGATEAQIQGWQSTAVLEEWVMELLGRIFFLLEIQLPSVSKRQTAEQNVSTMLCGFAHYLFQGLSPAIYETALDKLFRWASSHITMSTAKTVGHICNAACQANPKVGLKKFMPWLVDRIVALADGHALDASCEEEEDRADDELLWVLGIMSRVVKRTGVELLEYRTGIITVLEATLRLAAKPAAKLAGKLLRHVTRSLLDIYPINTGCLDATPEEFAADPIGVFERRGWCPGPREDSGLNVEFHVPTREERDFAEELTQQFFDDALNRLQRNCDEGTSHRVVLRRDLSIIRNITRVGLALMPESTQEPLPHPRSAIRWRPHPLCIAPPGVWEASTPEEDQARLSRRDRTCSTIHNLLLYLLRNHEDDTRSLIAVNKVIDQLLCVRGLRERKYQRAMAAYRYFKQVTKNVRTGNKLHSRVLLINRIHVQHLRRMTTNRLAVPYHETHLLLLHDLLTLGTSLYAHVRQKAQSSMFSSLLVYPQARHSLFPELLQKLDVAAATQPDASPSQIAIAHAQMKGALYLMASRYFSRFVTRYCSYLESFAKIIATMTQIEDTGVQVAVNKTFATFTQELRTIALGYNVPDSLGQHISHLPESAQQFQESQVHLDKKNQRKRGEFSSLIETLLSLLEGQSGHWRYELMLAGLLSYMLREDFATPASVVSFFVKNLTNDSLPMRELAIRSINIILALCKTPALKQVPPQAAETEGKCSQYGPRADNQAHCFRSESAARPSADNYDSISFVDKNFVAWSSWSSQVKVSYLPVKEQPVPQVRENPESPTAAGAEGSSAANNGIMLNFFRDEALFGAFVDFCSQDSHDESGDDEFDDSKAELFKGLTRNLRSAATSCIKPQLERLCADTRAASQRLAAEMVAGIVRGLKHWSWSEVEPVWDWLVPLASKTLDAVSNDSLADWANAVRFCVFDKDPRRIYRLLDMLLQPPLGDDEQESSFAKHRKLHFLHTALEELSWRGEEPAFALLNYLQGHLGHSYKLVREKIARCLYVVCRGVWVPDLAFGQPPQSRPEIAGFVDTIASALDRQSGVVAAGLDADVLVRQAKTILNWIVATFHDGSSVSILPYFPKLLPLIFYLPELSEDPELQLLCNQALSLCSQAVLPVWAAEPVFAVLFDIAQSPSWHVRRRLLRFAQVCMFRNYFSVPVEQLRSMLFQVLGDERVEVRELARLTMSGAVRCGLVPDDNVLIDHFRALAATRIRAKKKGQPQPATPADKQALVTRHSGVLGLSAMLTAFPYSVPTWMPELLVMIADHITDPEPIRGTVKKTMSEFWRTHQDNWQDMKPSFTEDQLYRITDLLISPSYYA